MEKILIIDDDEGLVHFLSRFFQRKGFDVTVCLTGQEALNTISQNGFDLILLDYKMPDFNGLDVLSEIRRIEVKTPVILMTAYGTTELAIETMKHGAYDYLTKPFDRQDLSRIVTDALCVNRQVKERVLISAGCADTIDPADGKTIRMVGHGKKMQEVFKLIGQVAPNDVSVLITGESGTGKELVARAIYHHSRRSDKPFITVNCGAIPEALFESELFGHERGAFTGADRTYIGKLERCDQGTLFLDEIGEMAPSAQVKLLRALQEGEIERVGGSHPVRVNVRVIAATNKNLEKEIEAGRFRKDLYWRLKVITMELPPLRQRQEDIPHLADYFLLRFCAEYKRPSCYLSESALNKLMAYTWPGNVRELENCIRRAVLLAAGDVIPESNLMIPDAEAEPMPEETTSGQLMARLKDQIEEIFPLLLRLPGQNIYADIIDLVETTLMARAMDACEGNQVQAAAMLGISRNTLRSRLKKQQDEPERSGGAD
ncbi:MAG: sigma-54 dependent transcriptional regulator [Thermodesulfobacteriota bacterium]